MVVVVVVVETPLTVPDLRGRPPLVVGETGEEIGVGLGLTLGRGVAEGSADARATADEEGVELSLDMRLVVALKVKKPTMPRAIIVMRPVINDFMAYIIR